MAKYVFVARHAPQVRVPSNHDVWQMNAPLADNAEARVREVSDYFASCGVRVMSIWHSSAVRTRKTAASFAARVNYPVEIVPEPLLGPGFIDEWNEKFMRWREGKPAGANPPTSVECAELWPDLCRREAQRVFSGVVKVAMSLRDGELALAFSHNPLIRLAQSRVIRKVCGPDPSYCEGVQFAFDNDTSDPSTAAFIGI